MRVQWRRNVLALVGFGYLLLLFVFLALMWGEGGMKADEAYSIINGPVMALIGGSLAIAKDLIDGDKSDELADNEANKAKPSQPDPAADEEKGE